MTHRTSRWTLVLVGIFVALLVGITGYAFAGVGLFNNLQTAQGQYVHNSGGVPGVTDRALLYTVIPNPAPAAASTNSSALTTLSMGNSSGHVDLYCARACTQGHFAEEFQFVITAQTAAEGFQMGVSAVAGANSVSTTIYFHIPATAGNATTTTLGLFVDLTASSVNLSGTAALQLCSSATLCP